MGMFDTIKIRNTTLPFPEDFKGVDFDTFQTKDFDCALDLYYIDNGLLFRDEVEREWVETEKDPNNFFDIGGHMKEISRKTVPIHHTGEVRFYDFRRDYTETSDLWIEFNATFVRGKMEECKLVKFEERDNSHRKSGETELSRQLEDYKKLRSKWYYPAIKVLDKIRNSVRDLLSGFLFSVARRSERIGFWIIKNF